MRPEALGVGSSVSRIRPAKVAHRLPVRTPDWQCVTRWALESLGEIPTGVLIRHLQEALRIMNRLVSTLLAAFVCVAAFGALASSAGAAGAPTEVKAIWVNPDLNSSGLSGTANPNGAPTTLNLEYGDGTGYHTVLTKEIG